ncbi:hypothetical protein [Spirosoma arcticum]
MQLTQTSPVPDTEYMDHTYAVMETTLLSYWDEGREMPDVFRRQTKEWISETVQCWWDLFVEHCCIVNDLNRTNYSRNLEEGYVDKPSLMYERLKNAMAFTKPEVIESARPLSSREQQAFDDLAIARLYYEEVWRSEVRVLSRAQCGLD